MHWMNHCPRNNSINFKATYPLNSDLSSGQRYWRGVGEIEADKNGISNFIFSPPPNILFRPVVASRGLVLCDYSLLPTLSAWLALMFSCYRRKWDIYCYWLTLTSEAQIWKFRVVVWQITSKKCTSMRAARAARLFCLNQSDHAVSSSPYCT